MFHMSFLFLILCGLVLNAAVEAKVITYPAPAGEKSSEDYTVSVNGHPVHVYTVDTLHGSPASFAYFDFSGAVDIAVTPTRQFTTAAILPESYGVKPKTAGKSLHFSLSKPCNLTIELDGGSDRVLHLFANPLEKNPHQPDDPSVIYYGPGLHTISAATIASGQTLYLAGGAIVRPVIRPEDKPVVEKDWSGQKNYGNLFTAENAKNITIRGRGILDLSLLPWHARTTFVIQNCNHVMVEGIIILDSPAWGIAVFGSNHVTVRNIKQICRRENSDGIDLCNTQDALVEDCFLRNNDDEVCVKATSPAPAQESRNILVRNCVIWNERARGLGITSETRTNISDVVFKDCDIIHDFSSGGDCASLAVLVSDSGVMKNIRFENIHVNDVHNTLFNGWIGADFWGHDKERGHVDGVILKNITVTSSGFPVSRIAGFDPSHLFENVTFENVHINETDVTNLENGHIQTNEYVQKVRFLP
jgi:hypothetical protein